MTQTQKLYSNAQLLNQKLLIFKSNKSCFILLYKHHIISQSPRLLIYKRWTEINWANQWVIKQPLTSENCFPSNSLKLSTITLSTTYSKFYSFHPRRSYVKSWIRKPSLKWSHWLKKYKYPQSFHRDCKSQVLRGEATRAWEVIVRPQLLDFYLSTAIAVSLNLRSSISNSFQRVQWATILYLILISHSEDLVLIVP